jgi:hypothetical protein
MESQAQTSRKDIARQFNINVRPETDDDLTFAEGDARSEVSEYAGDSLPPAKNPLLKLGLIMTGVSIAGALLYALVAGRSGSSLPIPEVAVSPTPNSKDATIASLTKELEATRSEAAVANQKAQGQKPQTLDKETPAQPPLVAATTPVKKTPQATSAQPTALAKKTPDSRQPVNQPTVQNVNYRKPVSVVQPPTARSIPDPKNEVALEQLKKRVDDSERKFDKLLSMLASDRKKQQVAVVPKKQEPKPFEKDKSVVSDTATPFASFYRR